MRATVTFVLRLLVDTDDPQALRGMIRAVGGAEEHAFADGQALLATLHQMAGVEPHTTNRQGRVTNVEPSTLFKEEQT